MSRCFESYPFNFFGIERTIHFSELVKSSSRVIKRKRISNDRSRIIDDDAIVLVFGNINSNVKHKNHLLSELAVTTDFLLSYNRV